MYLSELGGSSIDWSVRVWSITADYWDVRERLTNRIKDELDNKGIGIPYPQMDVHVDHTEATNGSSAGTPPDADRAV